MNCFNNEFKKVEKQILLVTSKENQLSKHPIVLYGAGGICSAAINFFEAQGIEVTCICDKKKKGFFGRSGIKVITPAELLKEYSHVIVVITSWRYEKEITEDLIHLGFPQDQICPFRPYSIPLDRFKTNYLQGYAWAYDNVTDDVSKKLVIEKMNAYLLDKPLTPTSAIGKMYYDNEIFSLGKDETLVDAGAYTGDTAEAFIKSVNGEYHYIWSFEPDEQNREQAEISLSQYPNISIVPKGLWSSSQNLTFFGVGEMDSTFIPVNSGDGGFSFISRDAEKQELEVVALDDLFADSLEENLPTFIKMDIEGAEKEAIIGMSNIIKQRKPKLAIAIDHKPDDIYTLPQTISAIRSDYHFYLRQYDHSFTETILYCI